MKPIVFFIVILLLVTYSIIRDYKKRKGSITRKEIVYISIGFSVMVIIGVVVTLYSSSQKRELFQNKKMSTGIISKYEPEGKSTTDEFVYQFNLNGFLFYGHHRGTWPNGGVDKFINKAFPVVYDSLNPNNSNMLMNDKDFIEYNIPFPDSLKWVLPYYAGNL